MLYKDLEELIEKGDVKENDVLWVCDFRFGSGGVLTKPIRHVKPTQVILLNNDKLPKNKKVYYSYYHFRTIKKNGSPSSTIIAPYDNTGYRTYTGVSLNIFFTEKECRDYYIEMCRKNKKIAEDEIENIKETVNQVLDEIEDNIKTQQFK